MEALAAKKIIAETPNSLNIGLMKLIWINVLAIVISLSSLLSDGPSVNFNYDQITTIQNIPLWHSDALKNPSEKNTEKNHLIAQNFIPIVVISHGHVDAGSFHYYLPLYSLNRQKEYFLLI